MDEIYTDKAVKIYILEYDKYKQLPIQINYDIIMIMFLEIYSSYFIMRKSQSNKICFIQGNWLIRLLLFIIILPMFALAKTQLSHQQKKFVDFMIPKIEKANRKILQKRQYLIKLYQSFTAKKKLNANDLVWLKNLAKHYGLSKLNFQQNATWQQLLARVDAVPTSLALAQAINESNWGKSRFAQEGNSYFGQWCSAPGCGLRPRLAEPNSPWQVRKFPNAYESINSYLHNLNRNPAYEELRAIRFELRETGRNLEPKLLANGLTKYSQRGENYVTIMQSIIQRFKLNELVQNYHSIASPTKF